MAQKKWKQDTERVVDAKLANSLQDMFSVVETLMRRVLAFPIAILIGYLIGRLTLY